MNRSGIADHSTPNVINFFSKLFIVPLAMAAGFVEPTFKQVAGIMRNNKTE